MSRFRKRLHAAIIAGFTAFGTTTATAEQPIVIPAAPEVAPESEVTPAGFGRAIRKHKPVICPPAHHGEMCPPLTTLPTPPTLPDPHPPAVTPPTTPTETPSPVASDLGSSFPEFGGLGRGAGAGPTVGLNGYIENAAPVTQFRLRYDSMYFNNRPDRAEFFYAKCGCFRTQLSPGDPLYDPNAKGPPLPETRVDAQELTPYFEYAFNPRLSMFVNIPIRFINPTANANAAGLSDISFGAKYAMIYNQNRIVTFLLQTVTPTGEIGSGLGTGNWWIEPGVLWLEQLNPKWQVFGEIRDRVYLSRQSDFTGNVLRYGLGTSYMVASGCSGYIAPVAECVGWTVLDGKELTENGPVSSAGTTIVNAKFGVRIGFGAVNPGVAYPTRSDLYVGYGRALTGAVWYKDMLRVEYRLFF